MRLVGMRLGSANELFKCLGPLHRKKTTWNLAVQQRHHAKKLPTHAKRKVRQRWVYLYTGPLKSKLQSEVWAVKLSSSRLMPIWQWATKGTAQAERCDILEFVKIGLSSRFGCHVNAGTSWSIGKCWPRPVVSAPSFDGEFRVPSATGCSNVREQSYSQQNNWWNLSTNKSPTRMKGIYVGFELISTTFFGVTWYEVFTKFQGNLRLIKALLENVATDWQDLNVKTLLINVKFACMNSWVFCIHTSCIVYPFKLLSITRVCRFRMW